MPAKAVEWHACPARQFPQTLFRLISPPQAQRLEDIMADPIVFPGTVEWSGENPGISLKERPDGPFVTLASFFRVVLSPHGRGHVLVLIQSPDEANPRAERGNYCLHDNGHSRAIS